MTQNDQPQKFSAACSEVIIFNGRRYASTVKLDATGDWQYSLTSLDPFSTFDDGFAVLQTVSQCLTDQAARLDPTVPLDQ